MQMQCVVQMANAELGRPLKKVWFVWSYMVEAVLPHDHAYERQQLPDRLPKSFSPDMIWTNLVVEPATVQPDHPNKDSRMLHTEFYPTMASSHAITYFCSDSKKTRFCPALSVCSVALMGL